MSSLLLLPHQTLHKMVCNRERGGKKAVSQLNPTQYGKSVTSSLFIVLERKKVNKPEGEGRNVTGRSSTYRSHTQVTILASSQEVEGERIKVDETKLLLTTLSTFFVNRHLTH